MDFSFNQDLFPNLDYHFGFLKGWIRHCAYKTIQGINKKVKGLIRVFK